MRERGAERKKFKIPVSQVVSVHEREHSYSTNTELETYKTPTSQMGFGHQEICREKEQFINRKGKILLLYEEVERPKSLSNSFGCHSASNSVCPESNCTSPLLTYAFLCLHYLRKRSSPSSSLFKLEKWHHSQYLP